MYTFEGSVEKMILALQNCRIIPHIKCGVISYKTKKVTDGNSNHQ